MSASPQERKISFRAPESLAKSLKLYCVGRGISLTYYLIQLIARDLEYQVSKAQELDQKVEKILSLRGINDI